MNITNVSSLESLNLIIAEEKRNYFNCSIVYRGQCKDHSFIPKMYRGDGSTHAPGCIPFYTMNWQSCAQKLIENLSGHRPNTNESQAVFQHYGYRSFFIDVTADIKVALWFSLHKYNSKSVPQYVDYELRSAVFQLSKYEVLSEGFFYIIAISKKNKKRFIDLTKIVDKSAARIHQQKGGALFCNDEVTTSDDLIIKKIRIVNDGWYNRSSINYKDESLFPPPSKDLFYQSLCTIPYSIPEKNSKIKYAIAHPLLGDFPIYCSSLDELAIEYLPLTRIMHETIPSKNWDILSGVTDLKQRRYKTLDSTIISLSPLPYQFDISIKNKLFNLEKVWPSKNLLLEFQPEACLANPRPVPQSEILRGMWIIFNEDTIKYSLIYDNFKSLKMDYKGTYLLSKITSLNKKGNNEDYPFGLSIFLKCSEQILNKQYILKKKKSNYYILKYN